MNIIITLSQIIGGIFSGSLFLIIEAFHKFYHPEVVKAIEEEKEIKDVHHIHIWKLNDHQVNLEAHLDFNDDITLSKSNRVIENLEQKLHDNFNIEHTTFQCEYAREDSKKIIA